MIYYSDNSRHLVCFPYSVDNLHLMAQELGIKRCWFHSSSYKHYDIPKRRIQEITNKSIVVDTRTILAICKGKDPNSRKF
jgi:uncharacterized protein DUF4031